MVAQAANWWERPDDDIRTQGGGRVTAYVTVTINAFFHCTGCDETVQVTTHTEADPTHLQNEILASLTGANFHADAHAKTCTKTPETT
jgi:hypothetical protein